MSSVSAPTINLVDRSVALKRDYGLGKENSGPTFQKAIDPKLIRDEAITHIRDLVKPDSRYEVITLRSPETELAYDVRRSNRRELGLGVFEHIKAQTASETAWCITKNPFSYDMKEGFKHFVVWFKGNKSFEEMKDRVALIAGRLFKGSDVHYYCQDEGHRSVPEIVHWHLLVRQDMESKERSRHLEAILTDSIIR